MQAVATTMGSTAFIELPAAPTAMLNAAMLARKRLANDTLGEAMRIFAIDTRYKPLECLVAVYQNLRRVLSVGDSLNVLMQDLTLMCRASSPFKKRSRKCHCQVIYPDYL